MFQPRLKKYETIYQNIKNSGENAVFFNRFEDIQQNPPLYGQEQLPYPDLWEEIDKWQEAADAETFDQQQQLQQDARDIAEQTQQSQQSHRRNMFNTGMMFGSRR